MLMLTRRINESVTLTDERTGETIGEVKLMGILSRNQVRLGFDIAPHVHVLRDNAVKKTRSQDAAS